MESAKVYFSDLRTDEISTLEKLRRLMKAAGFEQIDFKDKYVAVKLHFGEPGNMAYLRPNWARVVCDYVRALGGKPFLTDCNTLYVGGRANALDHLDSAMLNGYSPMTTGAQCIIADGLKGGDYDLVPIRGGKYLRAAKIGRAIMDADIFISLTHAKGHESTGFGGALKNIGMGCGSRAGKEEMHSSGKPVVDQDKCIGCGKCIENCAHNGPHIENGKCTILKFKCTGCGRCVHVCPMHAIHPDFDIANEADMAARPRPECEQLMHQAFDAMALTARSYDRILRVARTIADLDGAQTIGLAHLAEAIQYRTYDFSVAEP